LERETKPSSSQQKFLWLKDLLGTLFFVSFFVALLSSRSTTPPKPTQDSNNPKNRDNPSDGQTNKSENIPPATRKIPILTVERTEAPTTQNKPNDKRQQPATQTSQRVQWFMLLITIIYAGITALLWSNASEQSEIEERSWVIFDFNYSDKFKLGEVSSDIWVPFRLVNIGKTPAIKVEGFVVVEELRKGERPAFVNGANHAKKMRASILYPGSDWSQDFPVPELDEGGKSVLVTQPKQREYQSGNIFFIIWGQLEYFDAFHERHWVHFCHAITNNPLEKTTECNEYNTVDTQPHFGWNSVQRTPGRIVRSHD